MQSYLTAQEVMKMREVVSGITIHVSRQPNMFATLTLSRIQKCCPSAPYNAHFLSYNVTPFFVPFSVLKTDKAGFLTSLPNGQMCCDPALICLSVIILYIFPIYSHSGFQLQLCFTYKENQNFGPDSFTTHQLQSTSSNLL